MRTSLAVLFVSLLLPTLVGAQPQPDRDEPARPPVIRPIEPPIQPMPPIVLLVRQGDISTPLQVAKVDVDVTVLGSIAETRTTVTFYNPNSRAMAGDLYFPLPEGATVTGYALDIEGRMVDGVVVPKDKARRVYEIEVRKGVDPGIVEWVKGNNFKTRVFPIPPQGTRTVMVRYLTSLRADPSGALYELPLNFAEQVPDFHLRLEVIHSEVAPVVVQGGPANLKFSAGRESYIAEVTAQKAILTQPLVVKVPQPMQRWVRLQTAANETTYFDITDTIDPPAAGLPASIQPKQITLFWDDSGSRASASHEAEFALLDAFFKLQREAVSVQVVLFSNAVDGKKEFTIEKGDTSSLRTYLKEVAYDGGTQLSAIAPKAGEKAPDLYLLFSDGNSTFGNEEAAGFKAPLYAFASEPTANFPLLRHVATASGGAFFNLAHTKPADAAARIGNTQFSILEVKVVEGQVQDLLPAGVRPVTAPFHISGSLESASATLQVSFGVAGNVTETRQYVLKKSAAGSGETLRIWWAQQQIDALLTQPEKNRDLLLTLGKIHGLVTPETSLIVLETLEQYVEHQIVPPATQPELREAYFQAMRERDSEITEKKKEKIEVVLEMWKKRTDWFDKEYKYKKGFRYRDPESMSGTGDGEGMMMGVGGGGGSGRSVTAVRIGSPSAERPPADDRPEPAAAEERDAAERERAIQQTDSKAAAKKESGEGDNDPDEPGSEPTIEVKLSDPDTPYLKAIKAAGKGGMYAAYLKQRPEYLASPSFYLDCADFFFGKGQKHEALRILTNIAELKLDDPALLRILGHRLEQQEMLELSRGVFQQVLRLRPEEPQSYRDLGLVLGRLEQHKEAIELLYKVITTEWDRFAEIEVPTLMEMNRLVALAKQKKIDLTSLDLDPRLIRLLDVDVRIVLTWDSDMTDMDIWVTEPSGETAKYDHAETTIGGIVSKDFTDGYGPEEYLVRKAMKGKYKIEANYYGQSAPTVAGTVTVQATVYTNYGRPNEQRKALTLRLEKKKDVVYIGEISF